MAGLYLGRARAVRARMFTWEVVTDFDCDAPRESLEEAFAKEFPEVQGSPVFWKMVSFNAADGRKHRYLVALPGDGALESRGAGGRGLESRGREVGRSRGVERRGARRRGRALPESIGLYALADRATRSCDCGGNMRYAAVVEGVLYILVFMEGRLCHWSEENGYGGDSGALVAERLVRFDAFLTKDPLFSRAGARDENREVAQSANREASRAFATRFDSGATFGMFAEASRDPFWRNLDLFAAENANLRGRRRLAMLGGAVLLAMACVALAERFVAENLGECGAGPDGDCCAECSLGVAPELEAPDADSATVPGDVLGETPGAPSDAGEWVMGRAEEPSPRARTVLRVEEPPACGALALTIQGTVDGKLAQARLEGGELRWLGVGDSVGAFAVISIGSDRVQFVCSGKAVEVLNGSTAGGSEHAPR